LWSEPLAAARRRAAKTIDLLDYCNDPPFRRRILTPLNRGESRHALARDVGHGHRGELRQRYRQGQERTAQHARPDRQRESSTRWEGGRL
jgi:TnpA family transposase